MWYVNCIMRMVPLNLNMQGHIGLFIDQVLKLIQEPAGWLIRPKLDQYLFILFFIMNVNHCIMFNLITCTTAGVSLSVLEESEAMQLAYQKTKRALTRTAARAYQNSIV